MIPWRAAAGSTLALGGAAFLLARSRLDYLAPYWPQLLAAHGPRLAAELGLALLSVLAGLYQLFTLAGLSASGARLQVQRRALARGTGGDPDLAAALERDREQGGTA